MAGTRPSSPTRFADTSAVNRGAIDTGLRDVGFPAGAIIPAAQNNQRNFEVGEWLTYLSALSPASDVLDFRQWRCPDDAAYTVEWDGPSGTDGLLTATVERANIVAQGAGPTSNIVAVTRLGVGMTSGSYGHSFTYDYAAKTIGGDPPVFTETRFANSMVNFAAAGTVTPQAAGNVVFQSGVNATQSIYFYVGGWGGPMGTATVSGGADTFGIIRDCTLRVRTADTSVPGSPNIDINLQWYDTATQAWVTAATATISTDITTGGTGVDVSLPSVATTDAAVTAGAPLRLEVTCNAIVGTDQSFDLLYLTIRYLKTAAE